MNIYEIVRVTLLCREQVAIGLAPHAPSGEASSVKEMLLSLPPEEARLMRRKFRKQWRKALRRETSALADGRRKRQVTYCYMRKCFDPTPTQMVRRRHLVDAALLKRHGDTLSNAWLATYDAEMPLD